MLARFVFERKKKKVSLKPVLNWMNFCFANLVWGVWQTWKKFGELSSFLIGQTLLHEPSSGSSTNGTKLYSGSEMLYSTCSGNYLSSLVNLASDWLKRESSPMEVEKMGQQHMGDGVNVFSPLLQRKWPHLHVNLLEGECYPWDPADID